MKLLEKIMQVRDNKPPCIGCIYLIEPKDELFFCKIKDKIILPDYPPTKCELAEGGMEMEKHWNEEIIDRLEKEKGALRQENQQLRAALAQAREALSQIAMYDEYMSGADEVAKQTIAAIDALK